MPKSIPSHGKIGVGICSHPDDPGDLRKKLWRCPRVVNHVHRSQGLQVIMFDMYIYTTLHNISIYPIFVHLSVCPSVYLCIGLSMCLSIYRSIYLSIFLPAYITTSRWNLRSWKMVAWPCSLSVALSRRWLGLPLQDIAVVDVAKMMQSLKFKEWVSFLQWTNPTFGLLNCMEKSGT